MKEPRQSLRLLLIISFISVFVISDAFGQNDAKSEVNTAGTIDNPSKFAGKTVYRISHEDIQNLPGYSVADILNTLPGVHMGGAFGTHGTALSYNFRGGTNRQVLILIDGIPMTDPSSISNEYDLRLPDVSMVDEIEVLKGVSSTVYGTGAVTAVVNIKLRESETSKAKYTFSESVGSFLTSNTTARVEGRNFRLGYVASTSLGISRGFSAADEGELNTSFDDDGYLKSSTRVKLVYDKSEDLKKHYNLAFDYLKSGYDDGAFLDADNHFRLKQLNLSIGSTGRIVRRTGQNNGSRLPLSTATATPNPYLLGNSMMNALSSNIGTGQFQNNMAVTIINRAFDSSAPTNDTGIAISTNGVSSRKISDWLSWVSGRQTQLNILSDRDEDRYSFVLSFYHQLEFRLFPTFYVNGGVRASLYKTLSDVNLVYNINPVYILPLGSGNMLKVFGSYATGFIAPTLIQKTAPRFGNGSLDPEESSSWEIGTSLYLGDKFTFNVEYFNRTEDNAIDLVTLYDDFGNRLGAIYRNIEVERGISGFETDIRFKANSRLDLSGHFTKYQFNDASRFYQIPDTKYGMKATYALGQHTRVGVNFSYFGERQELNPEGNSTVSLDGFEVVDISFVHELKGRDLLISGGIRNLFNADFVNIYGFKSRPINFNIGVSAKF